MRVKNYNVMANRLAEKIKDETVVKCERLRQYLMNEFDYQRIPSIRSLEYWAYDRDEMETERHDGWKAIRFTGDHDG